MARTPKWRRALLAAIVGCASVAAAPQKEPLAPFTQAYTPTTVDERGIWSQADEEERALRDSPSVIRDPALNAYVRRVLCNTVGDDRCGAARIYIQRIPAFNAAMSPNGAMVVWSGLLLRTRSEAELGAVLGHEFGHFELRHSLSGFKSRRSGSDILAWASVLVAAGTYSNMRFDTYSRYYAFNRGQETDADLLGFRYLARSHYPSGAAADVWDRAMGESDATAFGRKGKTQHRYLAGIFATHPTDLARATYLRAASREVGDVKAAVPDGHASAMAKWLPLFLNDQVKLNDFGGSEYVLTGLAERGGWTAPLLFARGELYRERGNPRDLVSAAQFYREAIARGDAVAEAYRGLGLSLMRNGRPDEARTALAEYLRLKPDATDAAAIATLIS
jgi:beta-barrel assembly-enhancing protease